MTSFFNSEKPWDGSMDEKSVEATVYTHTFMNIQRSLFHAYEPDNEQDRMMISENCMFPEFAQ